MKILKMNEKSRKNRAGDGGILTKLLISQSLIAPEYNRFQAIKTDVLLIFSFITGDKTEFLSPMMFSNEYITGI